MQILAGILLKHL